MKSLIGWIFANILIFSGCISKAKKELSKTNIITPIYFHNPEKKQFEMLIKWFQDNDFVFISSEQLFRILTQKASCPKRALWISFDDGWQSNIHNVIPVVKEHDIPITIFISTQPILEGTFWWTKVTRHTSHGSKYIEEIKNISEDERRKVIRSIDKNMVLSQDYREAMTIDDIQNISKISQVTIGSHTVNHPILPNCTENQVEHEIKESQLLLEEWTGKQIVFFSYPNGDFDCREKKFLKKYGFKLATTTIPEFGHSDNDPYLFPRFCIMDNESFARNLCHALGVWQPMIAKIKKKIGYLK